MSSRPLEVALLGNAVDKLGGLDRYVSELAGALQALGVTVTLISKATDPDRPAREVRGDGVRLIRTQVPSKRDPTFALRYPFEIATGVVRALREVGPEAIVHGHFAVSTLPLVATRRRYLYTFHAPVWRELLSERQDSYVLPGPVRRPVVATLRASEAQVVSRASAVTVLSEFMRRQLAELSAGTARRAVLLPGGIDTARFSPGPARRPAWARDASPLLFTARRLVPRTGVLELVQAMPELLARFPGARLAVAGAGGQEQRIRDEIARLGLTDAVRLLGRVSDDELLDWDRSADLVVMPTQELEGFGLSTAEALACGTPVVGTPAGATPELLAPLSPLLVSDGVEPADIARALGGVLERPELLAQVRRDARARIHPAMGWPRIAERFVELYERLAHRPTRR